eukprot:3802095-Prymnesium_polylepis.1
MCIRDRSRGEREFGPKWATHRRRGVWVRGRCLGQNQSRGLGVWWGLDRVPARTASFGGVDVVLLDQRTTPPVD